MAAYTHETVHIQGVGSVPAVLASDVKVGNQRIYNGGSVYQITRIDNATAHFFDFTEISTETGEEHTHRVKKSRPVGLAPEGYRRPIGYQDAPATHYRAQVRAPQYGEWVTVSHGPTVEEAADGLTASGRSYSYFGTVMLDNHGLGWTKDNHNGRADAVKAMTNGETLTAADGHSFRILPPEQPQAPAPAAVEGTVIPAGHTLGIPARLADDVNARDAYAALVAAGHTPAELSNEEDDDRDDPAQGTGFKIDVRDGGQVLVYHLRNGADAWHAMSDQDRRAALRAYRDTLSAAGWETDGRLIRRVHAWRSSPLPEGVTVAQTRGEAPQEPVKVRFGLSEETRARLRESGQRARDEHRAEFDERARQEAAERAPLPVGTRVRHAVQAWATSVQAPKGTAVVIGVERQHGDGSFEYKVLRGRDISRRIGPDNPMDAPDEWNSARVRKVAPPRFEARSMSGQTLSGVWDVDTDRWLSCGLREEDAQAEAEGLNVGRLVLDAYGRIQHPEHPLPEMPTMDGHRFEIERTPGRTTIRMYADDQAAAVLEDWTGRAPHDESVPMIAREMVRVRTNLRKETAALLALDDATVYQVSTSAGDVETMTGAAARARLQSYREEAGPEKLHKRNSPRVTLEHSGARWLLTVHAYREDGGRDFRRNVRVAVVPQVAADAGQALMKGTGGGYLLPAESLSTEAFGPWVRPVPNFPEQVVVHWVVCGSPVPQDSARWEEHMETYRGVLEAAGWVYKVTTADGGMVFQEPARTA